MLDRATVTVDLAKIEENARRIVEALPCVSIVGVTKVTCSEPRVARAMIAGGVTALGESRLENAQRLRDAGIDVPIWLLRAPTPALAEETVRLIDVSAISEIAIARALSDAALAARRPHGILAMVDIGDRREGMMPDEVPAFVDAVESLAGLELVGLGASLTCYGTIVPDQRNLGMLAELVSAAERRVGRPLVMSGGSSTSIAPVMRGRGPAALDNLRVGEAIVLGVDPSTREQIPGLPLFTDAIRLSAPVIECAVKPSLPEGTCAQDAFGNRPVFEDRGPRHRAICAIGRQDVVPEHIQPLDARVQVLGASSDHLVLDVEDLPTPPAIGDPVVFVPGYSATLALFTSPYVRTVFAD